MLPLSSACGTIDAHKILSAVSMRVCPVSRVTLSAGTYPYHRPMPENGGPQEKTADLDTAHAHSARVYDYWLGGKDNFAADREAAEQALAVNPGIAADARANRLFLARAVHFLARAVHFLAAECGVRHA